MKKGKVIILSAPSGSGKSSILNQLLAKPELNPHFSISATSRLPRGNEKDGKEYHFLSLEDFEKKIKAGEFLEFEEVYKGTYYGTLRSEVEDAMKAGKNVFLDIDVKGALRVKEAFGDDALFVFIKPPGIDVLRQRLIGRGTESEENIALRLARAEEEISYAVHADQVITNDDLQTAIDECYTVIKAYLELD